MRGIAKEYDFGVLFHPAYSQEYRKSLFNKYAGIYHIRLYQVVLGFHFPRLIESDTPHGEHFMLANGFVVGDPH